MPAALCHHSFAVLAQAHDVGPHADEAVTHPYQGVEVAQGPDRAGIFPVCSTDLSDAAPCFDEQWVIPDRRRADPLAEIGRPKEEHVDAIQRRDRLQVVQRLRVLDLNADEALLVGLAEVLQGIDGTVGPVGVAPSTGRRPIG